MAEQDWEAYAASVSELEAETPEIRSAFEAGRKAGLEAASVAVAKIAPYNCELRPDGSSDRVTEAWVEGIHDAWEAVEALKKPETTPLEDLAEAVWASEFEIEQGHVHERGES